MKIHIKKIIENPTNEELIEEIFKLISKIMKEKKWKYCKENNPLITNLLYNIVLKKNT